MTECLAALQTTARVWAERHRVLRRCREIEGGCWVWTGCTSTNYDVRGHIRIGQRATSAYRFAYEAFIGPIPAGMLVCHKCDNGLCVRPDHLFLGTQADNMADMARKGRSTKGRPSAMRGEQHPRARLTALQVQAIRAAYVPYKTPARELAQRFGVSVSLVKKILQRKNWRWL